MACISNMDSNVYTLIPVNLPKSSSSSDETVEIHSPRNLIILPFYKQKRKGRKKSKHYCWWLITLLQNEWWQ